MLSRLEFFVTETLTSLRRHPAMAFAAVVCVAAALFVAGLVGLVLLNAEHSIGKLEDRVSLVVYFRSTPLLPRDQSLNAAERIRALPQVASAEFVTREVAWKKYQADHAASTKDFDFNPLPDAVHIKTRDLSQIDAVIAEVTAWKDIQGRSITDGASDPREVVTWVREARTSVSRFGPAIGFILVLLSLVIIHHTIELTLYARRKEIQIMSLVGATPGTVSTPFALEGLLYGIIGSGIALGLLYLLYGSVVRKLSATTSFALLTDPVILGRAALVVLIAGASLGLIGALISVTKFLRNPRSKTTNA